MNAIDRVTDGAKDLGLDFVAPFPVIAACLLLTMLFVVWIWKRTTRRVAVPYDHSSKPAGRGWWGSISAAETLLPLLGPGALRGAACSASVRVLS